MNTAILKAPIHINWIILRDRLRMLGIVAMSAAAGGWLVSVRDQAAQIPYQTAATHHYEAVEKVAGPNPVARVKCLTASNQVAKVKLGQAVEAADNLAITVPTPAIPNCPKK